MKINRIVCFAFAISFSFCAFVPKATAAASNVELVDLSAICRAQDGTTVIEIFTESVFPTRISLIINTVYRRLPFTYLVNDLVGTYNDKTKATIFSYDVDGHQVDVTIPDSPSADATISSPTEQTSYTLSCK